MRGLGFRRVLVGVTTLSVSLVGLVALSPAASAAVSPVVPRPNQAVTADALPTLQLDSPDGKAIAWTQAINGNTVYAGGTFSNVRPAGSAVGSNLTARGNLVAYDLTTGNLVTGFAPSLNTTVRALAVSPDGKRLYVGGVFTTANNAQRYRIAAYDTGTGALISSFTPTLNATVTAIAATDTTVYVGGYFGIANGANRTRLAAFRASDGALLTWAPTTDADINAMVLSPDRTKVVVGGAFQNVNGKPVQGITALDASTGSTAPWPVNQVIHNGNSQSGTYSLSADSDTIYGASYNYGTGDFEGQFAMNQDGSVKWLADCHGDTYSAFSPDNGVVYGAGHTHFCTNIGGFPDTSPRQHHHLMAFTKDATGTVNPNSQSGSGYGNFAGQPSPSIINYFPTLTNGTASGHSQAVWSLTGNKQYLAAGGEFPSVNGKAQYGLVRFAIPSIAPNKMGPVDLGGVTNPTVTGIGGYGARISWKLNWDQDDTNLTYKVIRSDKSSAPLHTATLASTFWQRPMTTFVDKTAEAGKTYRYRVLVSDPSGNGTQSDYVSVTMPTTSLSNYGKAVLDDGATNYWRLGDADQPTLSDLAGGNAMTKLSGVTPAAAGAISGDADTSARYDGTSAGVSGETTPVASSDTFSAEAWIKTTTTSGGKILGFGNSSTGKSSSYDRHVYMDNAGHLTFGVYPGSVQTVATQGAYNDGSWHHVVAELSPAGMELWVDGAQQGSNAAITTGQPYTGYWRIGGDSLGGWPSQGSSVYFAGQVDEVAIYPAALSAAQIRAHYGAAQGATNAAPTASFTADACPDGACAFDASASSDSDGTITSYAWDFGDGATGSGVRANHTYTKPGTYSVQLTVTDDLGARTSVTKDVTVTINKPPVAGLTVSCTARQCDFDGSTSSDPDGSVAGYAWTFGDGSTATGKTTSHLYAAAGTYTVTLKVTDDKGAVDSVSKDVTVSNANVKPTASFTSSCDTATCAFDASASSDSDGSVASYAWDFGDSKAGSGKTVTHTYAAGGTYTVKLTVTDDQGATGTASKSVTVTADSPVVAADRFSRSGSGWGSADTGGAWSVNKSSAFSTDGSAGQITVSAGATNTATLNSTSASDVTVSADVSVNKAATASGTYVNVESRHAGSSYYRLKVRFMADGTMHLAGSRVANGSATTLKEVVVSGLTYTPGTVLHVTFGVSGSSPVTLTGKVWEAAGTEPTKDQFSVQDSSPLQASGSVGIGAYLPSSATNAPVTVKVDNFGAVKP